MSEGWGSLPVLPLRCVLDHLSLEDALAALSTCKHWRSTILLYEGHKEELHLRVKNLEKSLFLMRMFKKHARKLYVYIDMNGGEELDHFSKIILPQFFDTQYLEELVIMGPSYTLVQEADVFKLNRIVIESLIVKNTHSLRRIIYLGCEMSTVKNENDRYIHKNVELYSKPLSFNSKYSPADTFISSCNADLMMFSALEHIIFDYELMSTETLETICQFSQVSKLGLNIGLRHPLFFPDVDWSVASSQLQVAVHITALGKKLMDNVCDKVFVEGVPLVSLKVFFCKTLHVKMVRDVVQRYKSTLRELVWADAPQDTDSYQKLTEEVNWPRIQHGCTVNPLILLCWQCNHLERIVLHGYWIWQYDIIGFVRLRKSLRSLFVSAICSRQKLFDTEMYNENIVRVQDRDIQMPIDKHFVEEVNSYTEFDWKPTPWKQLHPALCNGATAQQRADYVLTEISRQWGDYTN